MSYNKVQFGDQTLIDLTKDSVTPETLARGATAHDAAGNTIIGTAIGASLIAEQSDNGVRITATDHNGTTTATIFHGEKGSRGTGILQVTTEPEKYTGLTSGIQPIGRMLLSDLMSQAGVTEVLAGDCILHSYMLYHIYYTDDAYAYIDVSHSLRDGNGLGAQAASLLIKVLRSAVYNTDQSAYIDALEAAVQGGAVPDLPDIPDTPDVPDTPDDSDYTAIPLTVVKGAVTRVDGSKMTYDTTSSSATIRATTNPIAFYVESGKTYKISLSDYSTYGITLQTFTYSVKDTDFTVDAGTQRIINGDFTRLTTSGWKREEIVYTADGTADIITVMAAKGSAYNEELSAEDIAALNKMLTVKTNADMPDEPVLPDTPDTPDNPVNPDAETIPLSVVLGTAARVDGQKLTYDPTQTIRGATNPLAFYVEEGKTYTVSLSSYENYGFYPQGLSYSTSGTDFTVVDGTEKIFHGDFTRTLAPGWQYADYTFTADGTYQVIALQFRNIANTALTADDITALNGLLTVTVE